MSNSFVERVKSSLLDLCIHDNDAFHAIGLEILMKAETIKKDNNNNDINIKCFEMNMSCGINNFIENCHNVSALNDVLIKIKTILPNIIKRFGNNMSHDNIDNVEISEFHYLIRIVMEIIIKYLLTIHNIEYNSNNSIETLLIILKRKLYGIYQPSIFNSIFSLKSSVNAKVHITKITTNNITINDLCSTALYFNQMALDTKIFINKGSHVLRADKIYICHFYHKTGSCINGDTCRYAHDIEELKVINTTQQLGTHKRKYMELENGDNHQNSQHNKDNGHNKHNKHQKSHLEYDNPTYIEDSKSRSEYNKSYKYKDRKYGLFDKKHKDHGQHKQHKVKRKYGDSNSKYRENNKYSEDDREYIEYHDLKYEKDNYSKIADNTNSYKNDKKFEEPNTYKITLCKHFIAGSCNFGNECRFAHGFSDLTTIKCKNGINCTYPNCKFEHI